MRFWQRFDLHDQGSRWGWILVVLLTVFAVAPLTYPGFFQAQSGYLPAFNVEHLSDAPNWGREVDSIRGEGKLPYLLAWPFFRLSGSGIVAVKWGFGLAFVLAALGVYAWTRHWLGTKGAILAATVVTYLPWHLSTVYVRGAYAEAWLWAFWPFLLWAVDRLTERRPASILVAILVGLPTLAATFWTQPGLAALFTPVLVAYHATLSYRGRGRLLRLAGSLVLMLVTLWFVGRNAPPASLPFADHFLYPYQLLSAAWDVGLSFQLGLAAVGLSIVAIAIWVNNRSEQAQVPAETDATASDRGTPVQPLGAALWFWVATLIVLILLTVLPLTPLWQITGLGNYLTYPWQLLAWTGPALAFLAGSVVRLDERLAELPALAGLVALAVLASYPYLSPRFTQIDPGSEPVALIQPVHADAPQITLLDYEISPPTEITPTLTLTLTWQAVSPLSDDYTVFVHVLAEDDVKIAQRDTYPCEGECPTNAWLPGELVVDRHQLDLPPGAPSGPYRLAVGLYLLDTGERAAITGRDDRTIYLDVP